MVLRKLDDEKEGVIKMASRRNYRNKCIGYAYIVIEMSAMLQIKICKKQKLDRE